MLRGRARGKGFWPGGLVSSTTSGPACLIFGQLHRWIICGVGWRRRESAVLRRLPLRSSRGVRQVFEQGSTPRAGPKGGRSGCGPSPAPQALPALGRFALGCSGFAPRSPLPGRGGGAKPLLGVQTRVFVPGEPEPPAGAVMAPWGRRGACGDGPGAYQAWVGCGQAKQAITSAAQPVGSVRVWGRLSPRRAALGLPAVACALPVPPPQRRAREA